MELRRQFRTAVLSLLSAGILLGPAQASANWTFDENQCSPKTEHEVMTIPPPSAMLMVDRSGSMGGSKWSAAKSAIDSVTTDMTQPNPDEIEFGVGLFHGSGATINHEATANANPDIMNVLNSTSPGGGTPMETAIRTMTSSATVQGTIPPPSANYTSLGSVADNSDHYLPDSCQWRKFAIDVSGSATIDMIKMDLRIWHRYGIADHFVELHHGGNSVRLSAPGQGGVNPYGYSGWSGREIFDFAGDNMNGRWELWMADCWGGDDGFLDSWKLEFFETQSSAVAQRATAGILVTDGVPSYSRSGPVAAACDHRAIAPMYVVGLGTGTDREYNDVLAAAGGTGTCDNGDPCDNPSNWSAYDGHCDGSFQTGDANSLTAALSQIANEISCTFPLEVLGGGSVPSSTQGCEGYDCVSVVLDGGIGRIYHEDSAQTPRGWIWADSSRTTVKLNSTYCGEIQQENVHLVETQVACLCQKSFGTSCNVYDPHQCECETGRWACDYGTDVCEPNSADQCPDPLKGENEVCADGVGVCRDEGQTYCDAGGDLRCTARATAPEEDPEVTCDGRDNDCNGRVDDVNWEGDECQASAGRDQDAIDAETSRCGLGTATCSNGVEECVTLGAMPEVCNGLDDDCDDKIDNLSSSWNKTKKPDGSKYTLPDKYRAAACYERNVCTCLNGPDDIEGDDYQSYLEGWANKSDPPAPTCVCGGGLSE